MKSSILGVMLTGVLTLGATPAVAQQRGAANAANAAVTTTKIADGLYAIEGAGGRIGVLTGADGIFMVDAGLEAMTDKVVAAVRKISDAPIKFLVNTHIHPDHTGGDAAFGKMGVTILSRNELRKRLVDQEAPAAALPTITYDARVTVHFDGQEIDLIPEPHAHTDGDTMVHFPMLDVLMTGDFYRSEGYPYIDIKNGGSLKGLLAAVDDAIKVAGPNTKVLPGHGPIVNRTALMSHRDMIVKLRDRVEAMIKEGKSEQEILAAKITSSYDATIGRPDTADRFVGQLYAELKK